MKNFQCVLLMVSVLTCVAMAQTPTPSGTAINGTEKSMAEALRDTKFALTLFDHWETLIYLVYIPIFFILSRYVFSTCIMYDPKFDIANAVSNEDNKALALSYAGFILGIFIVMWGAMAEHKNGDNKARGENVGRCAFWIVVGVTWMLLGNAVCDYLWMFDVDNKTQILDGNRAVGIMEAGQFIANALIARYSIVGGSNKPLGEAFASSLLFFVLSSVFLLIFAYLFELFTVSYNIQEKVNDRNVAVGIMMGVGTVAFSLIILNPVSKTESLSTLGIWVALGYAWYFASWIFISVTVLPSTSFDEVRDGNWPSALVQSIILLSMSYVTIAFIDGSCFNTVEKNFNKRLSNTKDHKKIFQWVNLVFVGVVAVVVLAVKVMYAIPFWFTAWRAGVPCGDLSEATQLFMANPSQMKKINPKTLEIQKKTQQGYIALADPAADQEMTMQRQVSESHNMAPTELVQYSARQLNAFVTEFHALFDLNAGRDGADQTAANAKLATEALAVNSASRTEKINTLTAQLLQAPHGVKTVAAMAWASYGWTGKEFMGVEYPGDYFIESLAAARNKLVKACRDWLQFTQDMHNKFLPENQITVVSQPKDGVTPAINVPATNEKAYLLGIENVIRRAPLGIKAIVDAAWKPAPFFWDGESFSKIKGENGEIKTRIHTPEGRFNAFQQLFRTAESMQTAVGQKTSAYQTSSPGIAVGYSGYMFAVSLVLNGALTASNAPELNPGNVVAYAILWSALGLFLVGAGFRVASFLVWGNLEQKWDNTASSCVEAALCIASGLQLQSCLGGNSEGGSFQWDRDIVVVCIFFAISQVSLALVAKLYQILTPYDDVEQIRDGNVAAGVSAAMYIIAFALLAQNPMSKSDSVLNFFLFFVIAVIVLFLERLILRFFLPSNLDEEVRTDRNWGAAFIDGVTVIGIAICLCTFLHEKCSPDTTTGQVSG